MHKQCILRNYNKLKLNYKTVPFTIVLRNISNSEIKLNTYM